MEEKSELTKPAKRTSQEQVEESLSRSSRNQRQKQKNKTLIETQNKIAKRIVRTVVSLLLIVIVATGIFCCW